MTKAAVSDAELKVKHLREVLKLTAKFINEANKIEEVKYKWLKKKKEIACFI